MQKQGIDSSLTDRTERTKIERPNWLLIPQKDLYGYGISPYSLNEGEIRELIGKYAENAVREEQEGCFLVAEAYLRNAFMICQWHFPRQKVTARISTELGLFQSRFLPKSKQPAEYLKLSLSIEKVLDPNSNDYFAAVFNTVKCLLRAEEYEEAESLLQTLHVDEEDSEPGMRLITYKARVTLGRKDVLSAEATLRTHIEVVRNRYPGSELLLETLLYLSETLLENEKYEECERAICEALDSSWSPHPDHFSRVYAVVSLGAIRSEVRRNTDRDEGTVCSSLPHRASVHNIRRCFALL